MSTDRSPESANARRFAACAPARRPLRTRSAVIVIIVVYTTVWAMAAHGYAASDIEATLAAAGAAAAGLQRKPAGSRSGVETSL